MYSRLSNKLQDLGFQASKADTSLFLFKKGDIIIYFLVYVDDIIVVSSIPQATDALLLDLRDDFALKDLGSLHYFLGTEVSTNKHDLLLTQSKHGRDLIHHAGLTYCKAVSTPMAVFEKLTKNIGDPLDNNTATKYRSLVGGLQYLTLTRPDIAFAVNKVCQYLHSPTSIHFTAVKRILIYISGTVDFGLSIVPSRSNLVSAFSDAD